MCRPAEEIIAENQVAQELLDFIETERKKLTEGKNGDTVYRIAQARATIQSIVERTQMNEDMMQRFDRAEEKREKLDSEIKKSVSRIESVQESLKEHLKDHKEKEKESFRKKFISTPGKMVMSVTGIIIGIYTFLFFLFHSIMFGTGFNIMFTSFLERIVSGGG